MQGAGGTSRQVLIGLQGLAGNYFAYDAEGRWTPDNIDASKPRAFERGEAYWRENYVTNYSYQNGDYGRLKNVQLSYTIPATIQSKLRMKNAQIYVSGQNLLLLYNKNKYLDPEVGGLRIKASDGTKFRCLQLPDHESINSWCAFILLIPKQESIMKLNKQYIPILAFALLFFPACNKILDKSPLDKFSDQAIFSDINLANQYLLDTYNQSLIGAVGYIAFASLTDESHDTHGFETANYLKGNISPSATGPFGTWSFNYITWDGIYKNIQRINLFISKIDQIADGYPEAEQAGVKAKAEMMKAEATFLRAFCYHQLMRNFGGMILIKEPFKLGDDFSSQSRSSFQETVDFIVADCDAAAAVLGDKADMEMGRATRGAAFALKSRVLLFAASDLTADGAAASNLVGYEGADRTALWTAAKDAAKQVIDLGTYSLMDFGAPDQATVSQKYFEYFKSKDLSPAETIWGKMFLASVGRKKPDQPG